MALSVYVTISILTIQVAYHMRKRLSFLQNAIIFMVVTIITRQCLTLFSMEWGLYKITMNDWLFLCLILCRDLLTPLIGVIFINYYIHAKTWPSQVIAFLMSLGILLGVHKLSVYFELITFIKWNFFYTTILNAGFLFSAIVTLKVISYIQSLEKQQNESL